MQSPKSEYIYRQHQDTFLALVLLAFAGAGVMVWLAVWSFMSEQPDSLSYWAVVGKGIAYLLIGVGGVVSVLMGALSKSQRLVLSVDALRVTNMDRTKIEITIPYTTITGLLISERAGKPVLDIIHGQGKLTVQASRLATKASFDEFCRQLRDYMAFPQQVGMSITTKSGKDEEN